MEISRFQKILSWTRELDGVLTIRDLEVAFNEKPDVSLYRAIRKLLASGELVKVKRGIYASPDASLATISSRIYPQSYISTGTVLAKNLIIGSIPAKKIQAVRVGVPRTFEFSMGVVEYLSIKKELFFGFQREGNSNWASGEKAFLDACYFYYKGKAFSVDLHQDINFEKLDVDTLNRYLENYDKRFVSYFQRNWANELR